MKWLYRILRLFFTPGCRYVWVEKDSIKLTYVGRGDGAKKIRRIDLIMSCKGCGSIDVVNIADI